jgi:hypothetical protein
MEPSHSSSIEPAVEDTSTIVEAAMETTMHETAMREKASVREEAPMKKAREREKEWSRNKPANKERRRIAPPIRIIAGISANIHNGRTGLRIIVTVSTGIGRISRGLLGSHRCLGGRLCRRGCRNLLRVKFAAPLKHCADLSRGQSSIA